jgi:hypothetical protein
MSKVASWVAEKLEKEEQRLKVIDCTSDDFLVIHSKDDYTLRVAVLGVKDVIQVAHVQPLFAGATKPELVINVPSKTLWSGTAIEFVHSVPAAFGTMGDIARAAETKAAQLFRDKNMAFFINAMEQHSNVTAVSYVFDSVFRVDRRKGSPVTVAVIDAYNMGAEDVRNARNRVGHFDVVVKSSSYGSITGEAEAAADSMGAKALKFGELMQRLAK